jgi:hypothetical protein
MPRLIAAGSGASRPPSPSNLNNVYQHPPTLRGVRCRPPVGPPPAWGPVAKQATEQSVILGVSWFKAVFCFAPPNPPRLRSRVGSGKPSWIAVRRLHLVAVHISNRRQTGLQASLRTWGRSKPLGSRTRDGARPRTGQPPSDDPRRWQSITQRRTRRKEARSKSAHFGGGRECQPPPTGS